MIMSADSLDIWSTLLLAEADRLGLIDRDYYKQYLTGMLEGLGFTHFSKSDEHEAPRDAHIALEKPMINVKNQIDEYGCLMQYLERACELLNREKNLKVKYTPTRAFNCFVRSLRWLKPPVKYVERLKQYTDLELKTIKNVGQHTFRILSLARDLANADDAPLNTIDLYKWSQDVLAKYAKEDESHDADTKETEED